MNSYEKVNLTTIGNDGVHFEIEKNRDNPLDELDAKLMQFDAVLVGAEQVNTWFNSTEEFIQFCRARSHVVTFDDIQNIFVCTKGMPWME